MNDLIARLEAAKVPDRQIDGAIWAALQGVEILIFENPPSSGEVLSYRGTLKYPHIPGVAMYTASIDAAMTLVPEGHAVSVEWSPRFPGNAWIYPPNNRNDISFYGEASSPALALCAAALRARASLVTSTNRETGHAEKA